MSKGIPSYPSAAHTVFGHASDQTPWTVIRLSESGHMYVPFWFKTEAEAKTYARGAEGAFVLGCVFDKEAKDGAQVLA